MDIAVNFITQNVWTIAYTIWFTTLAVLLVMEKKSPTRTLAWLAILALFPIIGFFLYIVFGQKYRKHKRLKSKSLPEEWSKTLRKRAAQHIMLTDKLLQQLDSVPSNHTKWMRLLLNNASAPVTENNQIEVFQNGKDAFESMIQSLQNAVHHIHLEFYIFKNDNIGHKIQHILMEKAKAGVRVRVMIDGMGSLTLPNAFINEMRAAGVEVAYFLPVYFPWLSSRINFRNHRKIIVVDGKIGYIGGLNIGDEYLGNGPLGYWRDTHAKIQGDSVHYLQLIFLRDWYVAHNEYLPAPEYFPVQPKCERQQLMQIAASGPDTAWESVWQTYFSLIASAQKRIYLITPYLVPDESILMALKTAALSGLDVRIILPAKPEYYIVYYATKSYFDELLRAGVKIYGYQKGFIHAKVVLVDEEVASIGTANLDVRSFHYNFEVTALIYDTKLVKQLEADFMKDMQNSDEITREAYRMRPYKERLLEAGARLFSPLL